MKRLIALFLLFHLIPVSSDAQPMFTVNLMVEDTTAFTVYHNEPLVFTTSLVNNALLQNLKWNQDADQWLAQVAADFKAGKMTREAYDKETRFVTEGKKRVGVDVIGSVAQPWYRQLQFRVFSDKGTQQDPWPISILGDPATDPVAVLDENAFYLVKHHLSPEQVTRLTPGTYMVEVMLAGVSSGAARVTVLPGNIPPKELGRTGMLYRLGNYYLEARNADRVLSYADAILAIDKKHIDGFILSGEAYILKLDYKKALGFFEKALKELKKKDEDQEPPIYLLGTIAWLQERV